MAGKKGGGNGKKAKGKKRVKKLWKRYKVSGDKAERSGRFCPKCGPGFFMAMHQGRTYCGKCKYTEFESKAAAAEQKKPEMKKAAKK